MKLIIQSTCSFTQEQKLCRPACYVTMIMIFFLLLLFFLCSLSPILAASCPNSNFTCGNSTLDIHYPFSTSLDCPGIYLIQCINLVPMIQLSGHEYMYPLYNISYTDQTLIIHDLKLSLSPYPWGANCVFLYEFKVPIPRVNVSQLSQMGSFFNCRQKSSDFDAVFYNVSSCGDYDLYYTYGRNEDDRVPARCSSKSSFMWFNWKLSYGDHGDGNFSLLSAGFSRDLTPQPDCFECRIMGPDCSGDCRGGMSGKIKKKKNIIIGAIAATSGFLLSCILCFLWYRHNYIPHHPPPTPIFRTPSSSSPSFKKHRKLSSSIDYPTHVFTYTELQDATDHFNPSEELGDGGFGTVYKGLLHDGRTVAIKRLYDNNCKRVEQFINEVAILSCLRHPNLVTLYGCTSHHSPELLLVYELVSNGTLADHLHGPRAAERILTWPLRLTIAAETAEALAYLHAVEPPIIHRDVKTNNILLDNNFHVKVADFGLSRLFPADGATHVSTAPQGTPGYLDPEYHQCYQLTDKSDVYSYGVVLVELISSKQAVDITRGRYEINLASLALNKIRNKELEQLVDPGLGYQSDCEMKTMITLVAELAFRCLQMDKDMRPPIKEVLEELRGIAAIGNGSYGADKATARKGDDDGLLKSSTLFSLDSVTEKWVSSSSTLSSICSGTA